MFVKADFHYDLTGTLYRCPAGNALTLPGTREERRAIQVRRYWI